MTILAMDPHMPNTWAESGEKEGGGGGRRRRRRRRGEGERGQRGGGEGRDVRRMREEGRHDGWEAEREGVEGAEGMEKERRGWEGGRVGVEEGGRRRMEEECEESTMGRWLGRKCARKQIGSGFGEVEAVNSALEWNHTERSKQGRGRRDPSGRPASRTWWMTSRVTGNWTLVTVMSRMRPLPPPLVTDTVVLLGGALGSTPGRVISCLLEYCAIRVLASEKWASRNVYREEESSKRIVR
jgi:hypothetical protein